MCTLAWYLCEWSFLLHIFHKQVCLFFPEVPYPFFLWPVINFNEWFPRASIFFFTRNHLPAFLAFIYIFLHSIEFLSLLGILNLLVSFELIIILIFLLFLQNPVFLLLFLIIDSWVIFYIGITLHRSSPSKSFRLEIVSLDSQFGCSRYYSSLVRFI